ncbi:hypothetical protein ACFX1T_043876 [Malus domestica]
MGRSRILSPLEKQRGIRKSVHHTLLSLSIMSATFLAVEGERTVVVFLLNLRLLHSTPPSVPFQMCCHLKQHRVRLYSGTSVFICQVQHNLYQEKITIHRTTFKPEDQRVPSSSSHQHQRGTINGCQLSIRSLLFILTPLQMITSVSMQLFAISRLMQLHPETSET